MSAQIWYEWREAPQADFALVGDPVAASWSPKMHQAAYRALDMSYRYVAIRISSGDLTPALERLRNAGYLGVNCTVPLKQEAFAWAREPDVTATRIQAANTLDLSTRRATNTDVGGFQATLTGLRLPHPAKLLVLGAGGAAAAVLAAATGPGFGIDVWNRSCERAKSLVSRFHDVSAVAFPSLRGVDLVVNATSASLKGEALPLDWSEAAGSCIAYDLVYGAEPSNFLREAAKHGLATVDGKAMLVEQGALAFEWWLGKAAPRLAMETALG